MCDECIDDQYDNPSQNKCPDGYGCRPHKTAHLFITKSKNLVEYDAFGTQVCREYTEDETNFDAIRATID
jgi:hypothetical protein